MKNDKTRLESEIFYRLQTISRMKKENIQEKLVEFLAEYQPKKLRSEQQHKALHVDCNIIAEKLNDAGFDMRKVLKQQIEIPWTTESVKQYIWKPIQKAMFDKDSTKELEKNSDEIIKIHDVIMREFGKSPWNLEYHEFPYDPIKRKQLEESMALVHSTIDYPENKEEECPF